MIRPPHRFAETRWIAPIGVVVVLAALLALQGWQLACSSERRIGIDLEQDATGLYVGFVCEDGPAAAAGLLPGDRLVLVDGEPVWTIEEFDRSASGLEPGRPVAIVVDRGGERLARTAIPGMPVRWSGFAARIVVVVLSVLVGIVSWAGRTKDPRARLLAGLFLLIATEFALPRGAGPESWWRTFAALWFYVGTGAQLAVELHLASVIPAPRGWIARHNGLVRVFYAAGLLLAAGGTATFLADLAGGDLLPWSVDGFDVVLHRIGFPLWAGCLVALLATGGLRAPERRGRVQAMLVLLGVSPWVAYIGWEWGSRVAGWPLPDGWFEILPLVLAVYPISVFIAIFRYRLFELEVIVHRSLLYTALTGALVLAFYAALGAASAVFSRMIGAAADSVLTLSVATLVMGLLFSPLRRGARRLIERFLYPERAALRQRLIGLAGELSVIDRPDRLGEHVVRILQEIFDVKNVTLLQADREAEVLFTLAHSGPLSELQLRALEIDLDDPGIRSLRDEGRPTEVSQIFAESAELGRELWPIDARLAVPLEADERLAGVLLVGAKTAGPRFPAEERELLALFGHQVATTLDKLRLAASATYEELTGVLRREAVMEILDLEISRSMRYGRPLTIALADLDHFKGINDSFGHLEGDRVLRRAAEALAQHLRGSDGLGRYGGEEFLMVFPETDVAAAGPLAEKLRRAIEGIRLQAEDGSPISLSISIGLAGLPQLERVGLDPRRAMIAAADRALYRAKATGRNRVVSAREPLGEAIGASS